MSVTSLGDQLRDLVPLMERLRAQTRARAMREGAAPLVCFECDHRQEGPGPCERCGGSCEAPEAPTESARERLDRLVREAEGDEDGGVF